MRNEDELDERCWANTVIAIEAEKQNLFHIIEFLALDGFITVCMAFHYSNLAGMPQAARIQSLACETFRVRTGILQVNLNLIYVRWQLIAPSAM